MLTSRLGAALATVVCSVSCVVEEPSGYCPAEGEGETACPEGSVPDESGECRPPDTDAPSLAGPVEVTPAVGSAGTRFVLRFEVRGALARDPEVFLELGTSRSALAGAALEDGRWEFIYDADGGQPEGRHAVSILLAGTGGGTRVDASASLVFDFTPPGLLQAVVDRTVLGDGGEAVLSLSADEPLAGEPEVRFADGREWLSAEPVDPGVLSARYQAVATRDPEGPAEVRVTLVDLAGNRSEALAGPTVTFDFTAPELEAARMAPAALGDGGLLVVEITVTEELGEAPVLSAAAGPGPLDLGLPEVFGRHWRWARVVHADDPEGEYHLQVEATDEAGNTSSSLLPGRVRIDRTPPAVAPRTADVQPRLARAGQALEISFSVTEELPVPPLLLLGTTELPPPGPPAGLSYELRVPVRVMELAEGAQDVVVELEDAAGNRTRDATSLGRVTLDFAAPDALASLQPAAARVGDLVTLTLNASEPLADGSPMVLFLGLDAAAPAWEPFSAAVAEGLAYRFSRTAGVDLPSGRYAFSADLEDLAGNRSELELDVELVVDAEPPGIAAGPDLQPARPLRDGDELQVSFTATEPLAFPPRVRLGVADLGAPVVAEGPAGPFRWAYLVDAAVDAEGSREVAAELQDPAGNRTALVLGRVTFDLRAPGLVGVPAFTRCDGRGWALAGANEVYVAGDTACPGEGPVVRVTFAVDEPTEPAEPPRARAAGRSLPLVEGGAGDTRFSYGFSPAAGDPHATLEVTAEVRDPAGNDALLVLGTIHLDRFAPELADDEQTQLGLALVREPWGTEGSGGAPRTHLRVEVGAVPELAEVRVWRAVAGGFRRELGGARLDPAEPPDPEDPEEPELAWEIELGPEDVPEAWVTFTDRAGNESEPLPVRQTVWRGTPAGASADGPHRLRAGSADRREPLLPDSDGLFDVDAAARVQASRLDDQRLRASADSAPWRRRSPGVAPAARVDAAAVWDRYPGRLVLFGGRVAGGVVSAETWERGPRGWRLLRPATSPPARAGHAMASDLDRRRVVLFGGEGVSDTWEWDGTDWLERHPEEAPPVTSGAAMVYDAARRVTLLFGGQTDDGPSAETWAWDGGNWTRRQTAHVPPPRSGADLGWDLAWGEAVLFGGLGAQHGACGGVGRDCADTWVWNGIDWRQQEPDPAPAGRSGHRMVGRLEGGGVLLLGGRQSGPGDPVDLADLWAWDGAGWSRLEAEGPPARSGHAAGYDTGHGVATVVGGRVFDAGLGADRRLEDVWEWDGERWERTAPAEQPSGRDRVALAPGEGRAPVLLFGGRRLPDCGDIGENCGDTWEWDGARWRRLEPEVSPPARSGHAMARDMWRSRVVLYAGGGETWEWDGARWHALQLGPPPDASTGAALACLAASGTSLLFGGLVAGEPSAETWLWDGASWARSVTQEVPSARQGAGMAEGPTLEAPVLLFGGEGPDGVLGDTWRGSDDRWVLQEEAGPDARSWPALAADPVRERVVLFGGFDVEGRPLGDLWEWDDAGGWGRREPARLPPARGGAGMTWDPANREVVLFGGRGTGPGSCAAEEPDGQEDLGFCHHTWTWSPFNARPHVVASFDLGAARVVTPSGGDPTERRLLDVSLRTVAGGPGLATGYAVAVSAFGQGGWLVLHDTDQGRERDWAGTFGAGWGCGEAWCAGAAPETWPGADGCLHVDLRRPSSHWHASARVLLDYLELGVRTWRTGSEAPGERVPEGTPDGTPCSDGVAETLGETCQGWVCRP